MKTLMAAVLLTLVIASSSFVRGAGLAETRVLEVEARQVDFGAWKRAVEDIGKRHPAYEAKDYQAKVLQYEKDCPNCLADLAKIDERAPKGEWLSQNASFESSPLTEVHSKNVTLH